MNDVFYMFGKFFNRKICAVIRDDFGLVFPIYFNATNLSFDLGICLDQILYFDFILNSERRN